MILQVPGGGDPVDAANRLRSYSRDLLDDNVDVDVAALAEDLNSYAEMVEQSYLGRCEIQVPFADLFLVGKQGGKTEYHCTHDPFHVFPAQ